MGKEESKPQELIIIDASPLISVLKIERFDLYDVIPGPFICTEHVRGEISVPVQRERLETLLTHGKIREEQMVDPIDNLEMSRLRDTTALGRGEASAIVMAARMEASVVLDDKRARKAALRFKVKIISTADVVVANIRKGNLTVPELSPSTGLSFSRFRNPKTAIKPIASKPFPKTH